MDSPRSRLALGIAAVALVAGLCIVAVWSVRGRLPATPTVVSVAPAADQALRAENLRLRAEVARLKAERDSASPQTPVATASPVPPMPPPADERHPAGQPALPRHHAALTAPQKPDGFTEPQTFTSVSTAY